MIAFLAEYNAHNETVVGMRLTSYNTHVVDNKRIFYSYYPVWLIINVTECTAPTDQSKLIFD